MCWWHLVVECSVSEINSGLSFPRQLFVTILFDANDWKQQRKRSREGGDAKRGRSIPHTRLTPFAGKERGAIHQKKRRGLLVLVDNHRNRVTLEDEEEEEEELKAYLMHPDDRENAMQEKHNHHSIEDRDDGG